MKSLWAMIRLTLLTQFHLSVYRHRYLVRKEKLWQPLLFFLILLLLLPVLVMMIGGYGALYYGLSHINQETLLLQFFVVAAQVTALFFGFFFVISNLYLSGEIESLLPLPVTPRQVLIARFIGIWISELLPLLVMIFPGFIVYGVLSSAGMTYYLGVILLFPLLPLFPLVLVTILSMLIMRISNVKKHRDLLQAVGLIVGVAIFIVVQIFFRGDWVEENSSALEMIQEVLISFQSKLTTWFPQSVWVVDALTAPAFQEGLLGWGLFLGLNLLSLWLMITVGKSLLYPGVVGGNEVSSRRRVWKSRRQVQIGSARSPLSALFKREWKLYFRTPMFFLNGIAPIIMLIGASGAFTFTDNDKEIVSFLTDTSVTWDPAVWIGASMVIFLSSFTSVSSSSISREGKQFYISKLIPVPVALMIRAKWLFSLSISIFLIVLLGIVFGFFGVPLSSILWMVLIGVCLASICNLCGIMLDALIPNLKWTNPQEAVNKSYAGLLLVGLVGIVAGILAGMIAIAYYFGVPSLLIKLITLLLLLGVNWGVLKGTEAVARKRYEYIEA